MGKERKIVISWRMYDLLEHGYTKTYFEICEREEIDVIELLQELLQKGPDYFSGEDKERKQNALDRRKEGCLELLKLGHTKIYDATWSSAKINVTIRFQHYTDDRDGEKSYCNPSFEGFEHLGSMRKSAGFLEKLARSNFKAEYEFSADRGDTCSHQLKTPRQLIDALVRVKAVRVGSIDNKGCTHDLVRESGEIILRGEPEQVDEEEQAA